MASWRSHTVVAPISCAWTSISCAAGATERLSKLIGPPTTTSLLLRVAAVDHEEPDQGVRCGRGRPPHFGLRLCCFVGQAFSLRTRFPAGPAGRKAGLRAGLPAPQSMLAV